MSSSRAVPVCWMLAATVSVIPSMTVAGSVHEGPSRGGHLRVVATEETALVVEFELLGLEVGIDIVDGRTCRSVSVDGLDTERHAAGVRNDHGAGRDRGVSAGAAVPRSRPNRKPAIRGSTPASHDGR